LEILNKKGGAEPNRLYYLLLNKGDELHPRGQRIPEITVNNNSTMASP